MFAFFAMTTMMIIIVALLFKLHYSIFDGHADYCFSLHLFMMMLMMMVVFIYVHVCCLNNVLFTVCFIFLFSLLCCSCCCYRSCSW